MKPFVPHQKEAKKKKKKRAMRPRELCSKGSKRNFRGTGQPRELTQEQKGLGSGVTQSSHFPG